LQISPMYLALLEISVLLFAAEGSRGLVRALGIPAVVGELLVGMAIGPYALGPFINSLLGIPLVSINDYVELFAQFSVILMIFSSGLGEGLRGLERAGIWGFLGAIFGALLPFLGVTAALWHGLGSSVSLVMGAASAATSLAVASYVADEVGFSGPPRDFLLTAGAIDDVVSLIILSVALAISSGTGSPSSVVYTVAYYVLAWVIITADSIIILPRAANRLGERYARPFALLSLFSLVVIMVALGFSPLIAAYVAGLSLSTSRMSEAFKEMAVGLSSLFGPLFFVIAGAETDLVVGTLQALVLALLVSVLAMALKFAGTLPFAYAETKDKNGSVAASLGMIPRGEMGLAIASSSLAILTTSEYAAIVLMVVMTTIVGAISFSSFAKGTKRPSGKRGDRGPLSLKPLLRRGRAVLR